MRCESRQAESVRQRGADRIILWIGVDKSGDNMPSDCREAAKSAALTTSAGHQKRATPRGITLPSRKSGGEAPWGASSTAMDQ